MSTLKGVDGGSQLDFTAVTDKELDGISSDNVPGSMTLPARVEVEETILWLLPGIFRPILITVSSLSLSGLFLPTLLMNQRVVGATFYPTVSLSPTVSMSPA